MIPEYDENIRILACAGASLITLTDNESRLLSKIMHQVHSDRYNYALIEKEIETAVEHSAF